MNVNPKTRLPVLALLIIALARLSPAFAQVSEAWVATYNGSANAIALDKAGNIYVAGTAKDLDTLEDIITIKYDSNGNQLWVARYNGPGNGWDVARGLAVDTNGNVYVTGSSLGLGTDSDIVTIRYDANGNQVWADRYDRSGLGDHAYALAETGRNGSETETGQSSLMTLTRCVWLSSGQGLGRV